MVGVFASPFFGRVHGVSLFIVDEIARTSILISSVQFCIPPPIKKDHSQIQEVRRRTRRVGEESRGYRDLQRRAEDVHVLRGECCYFYRFLFISRVSLSADE